MSTEGFTLTVGGHRFAASQDAILALLASLKLEPEPVSEPEPVPVAEPEPEPEAEAAMEPEMPPKGWTWRHRVANMTEAPKRCDYETKRDWNVALSMYKYYKKAGERERVSVAREVSRLRKRADELAAGIGHTQRGRPAKVFYTTHPESK